MNLMKFNLILYKKRNNYSTERNF